MLKLPIAIFTLTAIFGADVECAQNLHNVQLHENHSI